MLHLLLWSHVWKVPSIALANVLSVVFCVPMNGMNGLESAVALFESVCE
jgi:hypothetical protein